ncbi:MAG: hypothetical protein JWQ35_2272 [Bacteriovoracaceae bacterium]|nr:hypothetical protein [Bacteriovoracaceae bacterium]
MEKVKTSAEYTIFKKRSGRYAILSNQKKYILGEEKIKILLKEKLITIEAPKPKAEAAPAAEEKPAA